MADALLANGGTVVVIGARQSNVPDFWDHPKIVFMDSEDAVKRGLPSNARGVVFTRFMSHSSFEAIMTEARKRNLEIFPVQGTGALKRTLSEIITASVPKPLPSVIAEPLPRRWDVVPTVGQLPIEDPPLVTTSQVADMLDVTSSAVQHWKDQGKIIPYGKRVLPDPNGRQVEQYAYTYDEVERVRKQHNPQGRKMALPPPPEPPPVPEPIVATPVTPPPAPPVAQTPAPTASPEAVAMAERSDLVRLCDDAISALQLVREAAIKTETGKAEMRRKFQELFGQ